MTSQRNSGRRQNRAEYALKAYRECARIRRQVTAELIPLAKRAMRELHSMEKGVAAIASELLHARERDPE